ncbi:MAG TPA: TonB family protein [Sphingobacteriaceae bacterium]
MNFFNYLFQVNLFLAMFIGFYWLVLRRETFFAHNRIYLNLSVVLSYVIPFIQSEWFQGLFITEQVREVTYAVPVSVIYEPVPIGYINQAPAFNWAFGIAAVYLIGALFFFGRLVVQLLSLRRELSAPGSQAFSFFGKMFIDDALPEKQTIENHEYVHIRQWHSLDVIFMEIMTVMNWFNPLAHLYRKEIKHVHEFIADEEASGQDKENYALLLLSQTLGVTPHQLTNSFFNESLLKRRIVMLSKSRSNRIGLLKYGLCAPLFGAMLVFSSATIVKKSETVRIADIIPSVTDKPEARRSNYSFIAKHPEVNGTRWSENGHRLDVFLKNGKTLSYDLQKSDDKAAAKARFGELPLSSLGNATAEKIEAEIAPNSQEFANLKKHIARSIKYPAAAKEADTNGYVLTRFSTNNGKIMNMEILSGSSEIFEQEAVRVLKGYTGKIEDGNYSLAIAFQMAGVKEKFRLPGNTGVTGTKFLGEVVVTAYNANLISPPPPPQEPKKASNENEQDNASFQLREIVVEGPQREAMKNVAGVQDDKIHDFSRVDELPKFPGGDKGFTQFLSNNIQYPQAAKVNNTTGRVIVTFVVAKDGSLEDIKILRGLGYGTDEETIRVLNLSPRWTPGKVKGKPVKVQYTIPVFYRLPKKVE